MGPRSSTGLHAKSAVRLSALLGALLLLGFGLAGTHATADGGPPLFFRVTVIEALAGDGPYDATVTIGPIHRRPWYPNTKIVAAELTLGMPSEWIDLSETVSAHADEATAVLSFTSAGSALKGFTRARLELTRDPATAEPLAAIEISDPGGRLGFILPERGTSDTNMPARFLSLLEVSRRHLAASAPLAVSAAERPKHFLASGSCWLFGNWYTDPTIAETEVQSLLNLGYNTMLDLPTEYADRVGVPYGGGADYRPPGVDEGTVDETALRAYYRQRADAIRDGSDSPQRFRMLAMSDEPGWGFPYEADLLNKKPEALERFHAYLREKGITPELLGKSSWDDVTLGASPQPSASLAERRLWYHTIRFSDRDQARRYAVATRALEAEGGTNVLGFVNWNNPGIFYSDLEPWLDCPIYCSHDWFTFSRARGSTCLWLGPGVSEVGTHYRSTFRMWSMILNLLRSAADQGVGRFGAYVHHNMIPNDRGYEVALSIMAVAGHGGAAYNSYVWGPRYTFTEYLWSEKFGHYPPAADANRLIGRSEFLMQGAAPPKAEIAILWPVTSQIYDLNLRGYWTYNRDFLTEAEQVWFALNHRNIPVDFVDEALVQDGSLSRYKVLYLTAPNLERRTAGAMADWVRSGGQLWTCAAAGMRDEYNEPMDLLDAVLGVTGRHVDRERVDYSPKGGLRWLDALGSVQMEPDAGLGEEPWPAYGSRATFSPADTASVLGRFADDGSPAVVRNSFGAGLSLHFASMPGLAYSRGANETDGQPTLDYPTRIGDLIAALPVQMGVRRPAVSSLPYVETAVLESARGLAVTLLNWSGRAVESLEVTLPTAVQVATVRSARLGPLPHKSRNAGEVTVELPMPQVIDVLLVTFVTQP